MPVIPVVISMHGETDEHLEGLEHSLVGEGRVVVLPQVGQPPQRLVRQRQLPDAEGDVACCRRLLSASEGGRTSDVRMSRPLAVLAARALLCIAAQRARPCTNGSLQMVLCAASEVSWHRVRHGGVAGVTIREASRKVTSATAPRRSASFSASGSMWRSRLM